MSGLWLIFTFTDNFLYFIAEYIAFEGYVYTTRLPGNVGLYLLTKPFNALVLLIYYTEYTILPARIAF